MKNNRMITHELANHINGKSSYFLYAEIYGTESMTFRIEVEVEGSDFGSQLIYANCDIVETMKEWNKILAEQED